MKNRGPGLFPKALTALALGFVGLSSAVIHAAPPPLDDAGSAPAFNGRDLKGWSMQAHAVWQVEDGELAGRQATAEGSAEAKPAISPAGRRSLCNEFEERIQNKLDMGLSAQRIHQDRTSEHGFVGS